MTTISAAHRATHEQRAVVDARAVAGVAGPPRARPGDGGPGLVALVEERHWDPCGRPGGRRRPAAWTCSACKFRIIWHFEGRNVARRRGTREREDAPATRGPRPRGAPAIPPGPARPRPLPAARADRLGRSRQRLDRARRARRPTRRGQADPARAGRSAGARCGSSARAARRRGSRTRRSSRSTRRATRPARTTSSRSSSTGPRSRGSTRTARSIERLRCSRSARRSPTRSRTRTSAASCTATSSPRT